MDRAPGTTGRRQGGGMEASQLPRYANSPHPCSVFIPAEPVTMASGHLLARCAQADGADPLPKPRFSRHVPGRSSETARGSSSTAGAVIALVLCWDGFLHPKFGPFHPCAGATSNSRGGGAKPGDPWGSIKCPSSLLTKQQAWAALVTCLGHIP